MTGRRQTKAWDDVSGLRTNAAARTTYRENCVGLEDLHIIRLEAYDPFRRTVAPKAVHGTQNGVDGAEQHNGGRDKKQKSDKNGKECVLVGDLEGIDKGGYARREHVVLLARHHRGRREVHMARRRRRREDVVRREAAVGVVDRVERAVGQRATRAVTQVVDGALDGTEVNEAESPCKVEDELTVCKRVIDGKKTLRRIVSGAGR